MNKFVGGDTFLIAKLKRTWQKVIHFSSSIMFIDFSFFFKKNTGESMIMNLCHYNYIHKVINAPEWSHSTNVSFRCTTLCLPQLYSKKYELRESLIPVNQFKVCPNTPLFYMKDCPVSLLTNFVWIYFISFNLIEISRYWGYVNLKLKLQHKFLSTKFFWLFTNEPCSHIKIL